MGKFLTNTKIPYKCEVKICYHTMQGPNPKGTPNLILHKDGHKYRVRSELLIFKDDKMLISKIDNKINQYGCRYKLPGGGVDDANEYIEEAAAREAEEEVRIRTTNVRYTGKYYDGLYDIVPEWHKHTLHLDGIEYDGYISFICTAEYAGKYNGYIKKMDRDDTIKTAKFYSYDEVKSILKPVHRKIFFEYLLNKNILKFNEWMNENIRYGKLVNGKAVLNPDDYDDYVTISPDALYQNKVGVCWDYVEYEANFFKEKFHMKQTCDEPKHMEFALYYMQHSDRDKDMPTHTWLAYNINGTFNIFESSWYANRGIHVFSSEDEMISYYLNKQESFYKEKKNPLHSPVIIRYNPRKKYGLSPEEYMKSVWNDGTRVKINRVDISQEAYTSHFVTEGILPKLVFYHGSGTEIKGNTIKADSMMLGNKIEAPSYAVFMWRKKENAYPWALYNLIRRICEKTNPDMFKKVRLDLFETPIKINIEESAYDTLLNATLGKKCYVYGCSTNISDLGLGHSAYLDEVVSKKDVRIVKRETITVTNKFFTDNTSVKTLEWFLDPANKNKYRSKYAGLLTRGLPNLLMHGDDTVFSLRSRIKDKIKEGKYKHGDDLNIIIADINKELNESYTSVTEAWNTTEMYHGSDLKLDVIKPTAYNRGNRLKKESWSVFMWPTYDLAYKWAIFIAIRNIIRGCEKQGLAHTPRGMHVSVGFNKYDFKVFAVEEDIPFIVEKMTGVKAYVYTLDCPIDTNFGFGNNNGQPEYSYDGELKPKKRKEIILTKKLLLDFIEPVSLEEYQTRTKNAFEKNIRGPLGLIFYPGWDVIKRWKYVYCRIGTGEINPGDDLSEVMKNFNDEEYQRARKAFRLMKYGHESYNGGDMMENTHFVTEGFFDRFKTKYSDGDLIKENDRLLKGIKYGNDSHWSTHTKPVSDKLYNMGPDKTGPSDRKAIIPIALKILRERLKRIKDTNFHKAIKPCKYEQDELRDWINKGEPLPIATWDMWKFTPKARTDDNADIYFNALMNNYLNDCNIRLGNRSFKLINQGDWDDGYISISDRNFVDESTVPEINHFVTESGGGTYDYPLTAKNKEKFMHELPSIAKAEVGRGYRGLVHCKLDQPTAHPIAFVNISITDGTVQASHGNPSVIGRLTAKLKKDISPNKKAVKENASHFVMVNEEENRPLINPYNKHGNIKVTRRATHRKPIKHPSLIKKYVNSHENYTDFF